MGHFLEVLNWVCYNIASVVYSGFLAVRHVGSSLPNQGWNPRPLVEGWRLNHWTAREALPPPFWREPSDRDFIKVTLPTSPSTCSCFKLPTLPACSLHEVLCPCLLLSRWPLWTQGGTRGQRLDWLHPGPILTQSLNFNPPGERSGSLGTFSHLPITSFISKTAAKIGFLHQV